MKEDWIACPKCGLKIKNEPIPNIQRLCILLILFLE